MIVVLLRLVPGIKAQTAAATRAINHMRINVDNTFSQFQLTRDSIELAEEIVQPLWFLLDQVSGHNSAVARYNYSCK